MSTKCPQCGASVDNTASNCKYCGEALNNVVAVAPAPVVPAYEAPQQAPMSGYQLDPGINPAWPMKNKVVAGLLGIFVGGLGIHKFYLGSPIWGIIYLLLCWTGIPSFIGFIEGLIYLIQNEHNFQTKNKVRTR